MASSKKKTEIRQAPKHLDKMLFINYKEEGRLQQKLKDLSNNSRMRGIELDREKVQVHNEMRLNKRRNSVPAVSSQVVSPPATRPSRSDSRQGTGPPLHFLRRRGSASNLSDPVNEYLMTEFKRVSEVIPSILSSLNKEDTGEDDEGGKSVGREGRTRKVVGDGERRPAVSNLISPLVHLDPDLKAFSRKETGRSEVDPNIEHIVSTIHSIKTLREDLSLKKRYDVTKTKTSFQDLLKTIQEEERRGSESNTYTDGTCVLLRRKMHKARRASCPVVEFSTAPEGSQRVGATSPSHGATTQQTRLPRCNTSLASLGRHSSWDAESMRAMLEEETRQLTKVKVDTELRRFDDIRTRIGQFLQEVEEPIRRRCSLPTFTNE